MLWENSVFRLESSVRRKITILLLVVLTLSFLTTADGLGNSKRRNWQPVQWYWQDITPLQYVRSFRNVAVSSNVNQYHFAWYQLLIGQFVFHKQQLGLQGIQIADWYRTEITISSNENVPTIILAAAIANQSNAATRPFNCNLFEKVQLWLGQTFDWHFSFGRAFWDDKFESPSIGIAQIMPNESHGDSPWLLFDQKTSIGLMLEKLQQASHAALNLKISENDWFALTLVSNNSGDGVVSAYQEYLHRYSLTPNSMKNFLESVPTNKQQLARMLGYVEFLSQHEGWSLPSNIDMNYLWSLVE